MLREYQEQDLASIRSWVNSKDTVQHLSDIFLSPQSENQSKAFLHQAMGDTWTGFVIALRDTMEYIGQIDFVSLDTKNGWGELGIIIGKESFRGKGYGQEAIEAFLRFGFEDLRLHRIELVCRANNSAARRLYEKTGFQQEGVLRQKWYREGVYHDEICYGILHSDWKPKTE